MKRKSLLIILAAGMATLICSSYGSGPYAGGAGNRTGSAGSTADCSGSTCHAGNNITTVVSVALFDNGLLVNQYEPGKTYRVLINATAQGTGRPGFGFQVSAVKASDATTQAGNFAVPTRTDIARKGGAPQIVEHTTPLAGTLFNGNYLDTVSFDWTAPAAGFGKVRFYAVVNAVNLSASSAGDAPNATTAEYDPTFTAVGNVGGEVPLYSQTR